MELLVVNEFTDRLLLVLSIEPPDVKTHQGKLLQLFLLVDISHSLCGNVSSTPIVFLLFAGVRSSTPVIHPVFAGVRSPLRSFLCPLYCFLRQFRRRFLAQHHLVVAFVVGEHPFSFP